MDGFFCEGETPAAALSTSELDSQGLMELVSGVDFEDDAAVESSSRRANGDSDEEMWF